MKERPIIFSAPMVRALLAGTKMQTRRVMKTQPAGGVYCGQASLTKSMSKPVVYAMWDLPTADGSTCCICPYGVPSDQLWTRETWAWYGCEYDLHEVVYRADLDELPPLYNRWRPSIHMPRWASRITLEITGVRSERLQDISEADAIAEGLESGNFGGWMERPANGPCIDHADPRRAYRALWESIHGAGSWDANPCCWVLTFRRSEAA